MSVIGGAGLEPQYDSFQWLAFDLTACGCAIRHSPLTPGASAPHSGRDLFMSHACTGFNCPGNGGGCFPLSPLFVVLLFEFPEGLCSLWGRTRHRDSVVFGGRRNRRLLKMFPEVWK